MNSPGVKTRRQSANRIQTPIEDLLAHAPFGIGLLTCADRRWTYINNSFVRMTGRRSSADFVGKTVHESLPETEKQGFYKMLEKACSGAEICRAMEMKLSLDCSASRSAGAHRREGYFNFGFQPLRDDNGRTKTVLIQAVDVTASVTARKALEADHEASQRLAAILESSDDAIASKDLTGTVTSWNRAAERMFGYTAKEMVGRSITKIIPPELQGDEAKILETIGRGEKIEHLETLRLNRAGERIDVSLTISPVRNDHGEIVGAAKIARDITQQKKAERSLRTSERLASVGRLAATVAHEINNPLEAITNLIFLAKSAVPREEANKYLAMAEDELTRVSQLTRQTLGFYREPKPVTRVAVGELIESLASVFSSRARKRRVKFQPEVREGAATLGLPAEMRQVLANLVANSMDAIEDGGHVRIRASATRSWRDGSEPGVRLTVADSGAGIPKSIQPKLFEPFFTTKKDVGTGLGLWVCKSIVENNRGSIRLKSCTEPGRSWTAFSVFLPLKLADTQALPALESKELLKRTA
jgi:PAS domain S-box-containing protein